MTVRAIMSYLAGIATFVLVAWVLRGLVGDEFALGIGCLAMLLVGYQFTRHLSGNRLTFTRWVLFSTLSAFGGSVVFIVMKRIA